ncbi:histidine kinase [Microbulbifer epialgicus]|uniref:Histidine kinase n=1 Tax=Microbulbifer epialgicus TaxID=393907 RepID=A0ABV4P6Q9_9GAMM
MKNTTIYVFAIFLFLLAACGGSSSGSDSGNNVVTVPAQPQNVSLSFQAVKLFQFTWDEVEGASYYRLQENPDGVSGFTQVGEDIPQGTETYTLEVPIYARINAQYLLQACNTEGCSDSEVLTVDSTLANSIGYFKASNTDKEDLFGYSVSLSKDGKTLAVAAPEESSNATGIDGDQNNNDAPESGAVYVFARIGADARWAQQAYLKASNTDRGDYFGYSVSLSGDGDTLAVAAVSESSNATGIDGDQGNNDASDSGAVYVFTRTSATWIQQAYIKASNTDRYDIFGNSISLSGDGNTLAVAAYQEGSNATGIDGDQSNNDAVNSGAVYVFVRIGTTWAQQTYLKASNADEYGLFGTSISLSSDGDTLAVAAVGDDSNAIGIDGDQSNNDAFFSGAVYMFARTGASWAQSAYVKASNTDDEDFFGSSISLSGDGSTLAVGARREDSNATGIDGDQNNNDAPSSGAVYVFARTGATWAQQAYIKASNTDYQDSFGSSISLSGDGNTLAVGAQEEDSNVTGINGNQSNNDASNSGAVYVLVRRGVIWTQQAHLKASNTFGVYLFGYSVSLSGDGRTLAVGTPGDKSDSTGISNNRSNDHSASFSGSAFIY